MTPKILVSALCAILISAGSAFAEWRINPERSAIHFGSIKKDAIGEIFSFDTFEGSVSDAGEFSVLIDLTSVETGVPIRNKRMKRHVFVQPTVTAKLSGSLDMSALTSMPIGQSGTVIVDGQLTFGEKVIPVATKFFVAHLSENSVLAITDSMIMVPLAKIGLTEGIDKLMKLAKLPSITRVSPVTLRLMFEK